MSAKAPKKAGNHVWKPVPAFALQ